MNIIKREVMIMNSMVKRKESRVFNCGYGEGYSVLEVVRGVKEVTGIDFEVVHSKRREGDPHALIADSKLITQTLNWKPRFNNLHYILKTAWEWEKKLANQMT